MIRKFEEAGATAGRNCGGCGEEIEATDAVCLMPTFPADDEEKAKAARGEHYVSCAAAMHWRCGVTMAGFIGEEVVR